MNDFSSFDYSHWPYFCFHTQSVFKVTHIKAIVRFNVDRNVSPELWMATTLDMKQECLPLKPHPPNPPSAVKCCFGGVESKVTQFFAKQLEYFFLFTVMWFGGGPKLGSHTPKIVALHYTTKLPRITKWLECKSCSVFPVARLNNFLCNEFIQMKMLEFPLMQIE